MFTVAIEGARKHQHFQEIEGFVGTGRLYLKGTDQAYFVDYQDRASADLAVVNLNQIEGIKARLLPRRG